MAKNKNKRKNKPKADAVRLANIKKKSQSGISAVRKNPFEVKINKQKHSILNKKKKHHFGLPGVSRSAAIKKREKTILADMVKEKNVSIVRDKRIGASNSDMTLEEKMLQRMTMERKKRHNKKEMFNLNDDHEIELTHNGQSLSSIKKFNDDDFSDDDNDIIDNDGRKQGADTTDHFGGGFFTRKVEQNQGLTPLEDIIRKSKLEKMEKRVSKDKQQDMLDKLDAVFKTLRPSLTSRDDADKEKEANRGDVFGNNVRRMGMSRERASAPTRLKTDEELERERLAKQKEMEEARLRRMKGWKEESKEKKGKKKMQSLDALCDDYVFDDKSNEDPFILSFPYRAEEEGAIEDDGMLVADDDDIDEDDESDGAVNDSELDGNLVLSDIEDEDEEEEEDLSGSGDYGIYEDESPNHQRVAVAADSDADDSDDDDTEDNFSDIDSGNEDSADLVSLDDEEDDDDDDDEDDDEAAPAPSAAPKRKKSSAKEALKFPDSSAQFCDMVEACEMSAHQLVSKLRQQFAPHLGEGHKQSLGKLYEYLWVYCTEITGKSEFEWSQMDPMIGHLYDLCLLNPEPCCDITRNILQHSYKECFQQTDDSSEQSAASSPSWPALKHLVQLKMVKDIFPTSDLRHPVASPALIFMTRMLQQCRINSLRDLSAGLFVVTMCYEYVSFSKRLLPECLNFLACAMAARLSTASLVEADVRKAISSRSFRSRTCKLLVPRSNATDNKEKETAAENSNDDDGDTRINLIEALQRQSQDKKKEDATSDDPLRRHLFQLAVKLLLEFARIYQHNVCFDQLFAPHRVILTRLKLDVESTSDVDGDVDGADDLLNNACDVVQATGGKSRAYMTFGRSKPAMLAMVTPKFDEDVGDPFVKRSKKTDSAKRNTERLLHKKKSEARGAIREIRKDSKFIATHELKKREEADAEREAAVKRIHGLIADQEGEYRNIKRQKYKLDM